MCIEILLTVSSHNQADKWWEKKKFIKKIRLRHLCERVQMTHINGLETCVSRYFTAPFNNMRTLKFRAQPTNAFFATVDQMFGGSSQPPTTAERAVIKSLCTVQTTKQCSAVVVRWEKRPNMWLTAAKNAFVGRLLNFRVRMLLKSAVSCDVSKSEKNYLTADDKVSVSV